MSKFRELFVESGKLKERYIRFVSFFFLILSIMKGNQKWRKLKSKLGVKLKIGLITVIKSCLYFVFFFVCCFAYTKRELYKLKVKHNKYQYIYKILYISLSVCVWVCVSLMLLCCWTIWFRITLLYIYYIYRVYISIGIALSI